ncbi:hypothetical protein DFH11DRAFT_1747461 [Phellopilus nigrolimitatus]|nr:hypothetical protein DFH11DRAFT_1747461 [Phellopilus nigrolimitatus]
MRRDTVFGEREWRTNVRAAARVRISSGHSYDSFTGIKVDLHNAAMILSAEANSVNRPYTLASSVALMDANLRAEKGSPAYECTCSMSSPHLSTLKHLITFFAFTGIAGLILNNMIF